MTKAYLDTNIFATFFLAKYLPKEEDKRIKIEKKLMEFSEQYEFVTSPFTMAELLKILLKHDKINNLIKKGQIDMVDYERDVGQYTNQLIMSKLIPATHIHFEVVDLMNKKIKYGNRKQFNKIINRYITEFFYEATKKMVNYGLSLADAIHLIFMERNKIKTIITTDSDFEKIREKFRVIILSPP